MRSLSRSARQSANLVGVLFFGFVFSLSLAAHPEGSACDSEDVRAVADNAFTSRLSALKLPTLPPGAEPTEEDHLKAQEFQHAVKFFERVTGISSEFSEYHGVSIPSDTVEVQNAIRRWQDWRLRSESDIDSDILICLIDRDVTEGEGLLREIYRRRFDQGEVIDGPWVSFDMPVLGESILERSRDGGQRPFLSMINLGMLGEFSLLQWSVDDLSPSSVMSAIREIPDVVAMGFWSFGESRRLTVRFSVFDKCLLSNQRLEEFVTELAGAGKDLNFRGARFRSSEEVLAPDGRRSLRVQTTRLWEEHQRCLLWLRH